MIHQNKSGLTPLVSVVMPVYNSSRFLRQSVDSVLNQTYRNFELIMVDDCSTDDSMKIMREYAQKDHRIRVLEGEKNQGVAYARNRAIRIAKGEYIALLDSDDIWKETKLEKQVEQLKKEDADISYCAAELVDENGKQMNRIFHVPAKTDYRQMLVKNVIICSTAIVRTELLRAHPFSKKYYHEDYALWMELMSIPVKAVGRTEVLAYYRQVSGSRSNNKMNAAIQRWKIYREALGLSVIKSCAAFAKYAFWGVVKYYF